MTTQKHLFLSNLLIGWACCLPLAAQQQASPAAPSLADRIQIDRYKVNQQRARDLTTDLLSILVDRQMQQLEDNMIE